MTQDAAPIRHGGLTAAELSMVTMLESLVMNDPLFPWAPSDKRKLLALLWRQAARAEGAEREAARLREAAGEVAEYLAREYREGEKPYQAVIALRAALAPPQDAGKEAP